MLDSLRNLLFPKSAIDVDAKAKVDTSMTDVNNGGTSSNNNDDHTDATSHNNGNDSRVDPAAGPSGHGHPSGVRGGVPSAGNMPHTNTTATPSAKHDIPVGTTCEDGNDETDGSHNNDVVSKICTPSPSAMNTTNDATSTDDVVPNPSIDAATGDDSLSNDDEKMPATNPKNDDSSQGIAMPSLKEAAAVGCKKCQKELDSGINTKYAHDSKCPRKWHSKGGCPKKQAKISVSKHCTGTADEKDANVTHHMKGNGDNNNKGKVLHPIRMNEKGTGKDGEDGHDSPRTPYNPCDKIDGVVSIAEGAAFGCSKCKRELQSGRKAMGPHNADCPRKTRLGVSCEKSVVLRSTRWSLRKKDGSYGRGSSRNKGDQNPSKRDNTIETKEFSFDNRRSGRVHSAPELFVARPSKSGVGVKEGDEEFVAKRTDDEPLSTICNGEGRPKKIGKARLDQDSLKNRRASGRLRSAPELFVARPSKQGLGVNEGDEQFLGTTGGGSLSALAKAAAEDESEEELHQLNHAPHHDTTQLCISHYRHESSRIPNNACGKIDGVVSVAEGAAFGCSKCQRELQSGRKAMGPHHACCPRKTRLGVSCEKSVVLRSTRNKGDQNPRKRENMIEQKEFNFDNRRSGRVRSAPELFVARPSKQGAGVKEGDEQFLGTTGGGMSSALAKAAAEDESEDEQKSRAWSSNEDMELVRQVSKHGTRWATILAESTILAQRSRDAIKWRWRSQHWRLRSQLVNAEVHEVRRQHTSLEEAAALGCNKCKTELDTGEKSRRVHADSCPRKRGYVERDDEGVALRSTRSSLRSKCMNAEVYDEESWSEDEDEVSDTQAKRLWSSEEDMELVKQVSKHGTRWATILAESTILANRYAGASSVKIARQCISKRWSSQFMGAEEYGGDSESDEDAEDEGGDNQAKRLWSSEEDMELVKQVSKHGTRWATILAESTILANRYAGASSVKIARQCITNRWRSQFMGAEEYGNPLNADISGEESESGIEDEDENENETDKYDEDSSSENEEQSDSESEVSLSSYERLREERIKRNNARLVQLGLLKKKPVPAAAGGKRNTSVLTDLLTADNNSKRNTAPQKKNHDGLMMTIRRSLRNSARRANASLKPDTRESCFGTALLKDAAASGCRKCQKELENGTKAMGPHSTGCPRRCMQRTRYQAHESSDSESDSEATDSSIDIKFCFGDIVRWSSEEDEELLRLVDVYGNNWKGVLENSSLLKKRYVSSSLVSARTSIAGRYNRKHMNEEAKFEYDSDEDMQSAAEQSEGDISDGNDETCHAIASLKDAAASGCRKCQKELASGAKAMGPHSTGCPRRFVQRTSYQAHESSDGEENGSSIDIKFCFGDNMRWSREEDEELLRLVDVYGNNWKGVLENSSLLKKRYASSTLVSARSSIAGRYNRKHMNEEAEFEDDSDEDMQSAAEQSEGDISDGNDETCHAIASLKDAAASGCRKCQKELASGAKAMGPHTTGCPRKPVSRVLDSDNSASSVGNDNESVESYAYAKEDEDLMPFESILADDDASVVSSIDVDNSRSDSTPREDWKYIPGFNRRTLLKQICDKKATGDLTVVQLSKRGSSAKNIMKNMFLVVPDIVSKEWHEGTAIESNALFVMMQVQDIISVYDDDQKQVCDASSWDIYAQADKNANVVNYFDVDEVGDHVAHFEVALVGGVYKWFCLLHHMEQDRLQRAHRDSLMEDVDTLGPHTVVVHQNRSVIPSYLYLALEQMQFCHFVADANQAEYGKPGLECKHCNDFRVFPSSAEALPTECDQIVEHAQSCNEHPYYIQRELATLQKSHAYKKTRTLRSTVTMNGCELDEGKQDFFKELWARIKSQEPTCETTGVAWKRKDSSLQTSSTKKRTADSRHDESRLGNELLGKTGNTIAGAKGLLDETENDINTNATSTSKETNMIQEQQQLILEPKANTNKPLLVHVPASGQSSLGKRKDLPADSLSPSSPAKKRAATSQRSKEIKAAKEKEAQMQKKKDADMKKAEAAERKDKLLRVKASTSPAPVNIAVAKHCTWVGSKVEPLNASKARFCQATVTINKPSKDSKIGIGIHQLPGGPIEVSCIAPGSVFVGTPVTVGLVLEFVNGIKCTNCAATVSLMKETVGPMTVVAVGRESMFWFTTSGSIQN